MLDVVTAVTRRVYTIGHSNHSFDRFLDLLRRHGVDAVVDTRSYPSSRHAPQFNEPALRRALQEHGIAYAFRGHELGGRPAAAEFYDADGYVLYDRLAASPAFLQGIVWLEPRLAARRLALLCSEEDPAGCHRRLLIGRVLHARGVTVCHIRGDGTLRTEDDLLAAEQAAQANGYQKALFEAVEAPAWKSARSVLPRSRRRRSSAR